MTRDELFEDFFNNLKGIGLLGPAHRNYERISRKATWDAAWKACLESGNPLWRQVKDALPCLILGDLDSDPEIMPGKIYLSTDEGVEP